MTHWTPSIHMPRAASRLTLAITDVTKHRLHAMTNKDATAEGVFHVNGGGYTADGETYWLEPIPAFQHLWNSLHGPGAWQVNPEVIAIHFKWHECNIDRSSLRFGGAWPTIMSAPMVRAIMAGRKTVTRRLPSSMWEKILAAHQAQPTWPHCLYVRESFRRPDGFASDAVVYRADEEEGA